MIMLRESRGYIDFGRERIEKRDDRRRRWREEEMLMRRTYEFVIKVVCC